MPLRRTIPIAEDGGMHLPAEIRRALGLSGPGRIVLTQDESGIRLTTDDPLRRVRELAAPYRRHSRSVVDEFIAERRAESAED